jgi:thiol-disulfide isomerase/thioredoxin
MKIQRILAALLAVLLLCGCAHTPTVPEETTEPANVLTGPITLGMKMPELSVTTARGETLLLSELLEQKKAVVLNFWFADCIWCVREFPVMEVVYDRYREDLEILALNPYDSDQTIDAFQQEHSLSFPMGRCSQDLAYALGVNGYPTSVVIDREGTVSLIHSGAITDTEVFDQLFATFTASDYTPRVYNSISELFS